MDIVIRLRELRRLSGLSQKEVADRSGLGVRTISSFESGSRIDSMKLSQLERLLEVYGVSDSEFFGGELDEKFDPFLADAKKDARKISDRLLNMPDDLRHQIVQRISLLVESADDLRSGLPSHPWTIGQVEEWQLLNSHN